MKVSLLAWLISCITVPFYIYWKNRIQIVGETSRIFFLKIVCLIRSTLSNSRSSISLSTYVYMIKHVQQKKLVVIIEENFLQRKQYVISVPIVANLIGIRSAVLHYIQCTNIYLNDIMVDTAWYIWFFLHFEIRIEKKLLSWMKTNLEVDIP